MILDTNVWVAERLLQSSTGSALLYAFTSAGAIIALPEVVELEINEVLTAQAEGALSNIARGVSLLRQLSGYRLAFDAPTPLAVAEGIARRWNHLVGAVQRMPFTFYHPRDALHLFIRKSRSRGY